ncbi:MAG: hypothetical protein ACI8VC_002258 [Candidatus Endobugula sp.]|jgi:hypothetical protein
MSVRPKSISIISWFLIVTGCMSLVSPALTYDNPEVIKVMELNALSVPIQYIMMFVGSLVTVVSGIGILMGKNYARILYVSWTSLSIIISFFTLPVTTMMIPGIVFFAIISFFLFRAKSKNYFSGEIEEGSSDILPSPNKPVKVRNIFGVMFLIFSGFFVYMVGLLAFFELPDAGTGKFVILAGAFVPLVIFHLIGLALYRGANWKISTGVTFFIGSSFNVLVVIVMLFIQASPEALGGMDTSGLSAFSSYLSGFSVMVLLSGSGAFLYFAGKANKLSQADASAAA